MRSKSEQKKNFYILHLFVSFQSSSSFHNTNFHFIVSKALSTLLFASTMIHIEIYNDDNMLGTSEPTMLI